MSASDAEDVREIVARWLANHGYDGLYDLDGDWDGCSCRTADLMPCDGESANCKPGVLCAAPADADPECEWYIGPKKPKVQP